MEIKRSTIKDENLREAVRVFQIVEEYNSDGGKLDIIGYGLLNLCTYLAKQDIVKGDT
jgi:hypothetical protein